MIIVQRTGLATLPLHYGSAPRWLFGRMVKLADGIVRIMVDEYGAEEFLKRLSSDVMYSVTKQGIISSLRNGTGFWYHADHGEINGVALGGEGRIGVFDEDVWRAYEDGGSTASPDIVDKYGGKKQDCLVMPLEENWLHGNEFKNMGNLHSTMAVFMDCAIASTQIPLILLEHGAVNVAASFTTIHFSAGGYFTTGFTRRLCNGDTVGNAFTNSLVESAPAYYDNSGYSNGTSLNFVLFGDPSVKLRAHELNVGVKYPMPVIKQFDGKLEIYVKDENGKTIEDANVTVNNVSVSYDSDADCYVYNLNNLNVGNHNMGIEVSKDMCGTTGTMVSLKVVDFRDEYKLIIVGSIMLLCIVVIESVLYARKRKRRKQEEKEHVGK